MRASLIVIAIALIGVSSDVRAQRVTGVIRDSASASVIAGAVVTVVDSSGATGLRTLSDRTGRYSILVSRSGDHLHVVRIGFRPRDVPTPHTTPTLLLRDIAMERLPSMLDAVMVSGRELCPGSASRGGAFEVWEQVRSGLLALVVARQAKLTFTNSLTFERTFLANDNLVRRQSTTARSGNTIHVFAAPASPAEFALHGYAEDDSSGGRTYNAPDAEVLLDESFAATHCLRLESASAQHPGQIGLAFTPVHSPERDTLIDVAGTIWLDVKIPAIQLLEFRYSGLEPAAERAAIGGHIRFRAMPDGVEFIDDWVLRLPIMARVADTSESASNVRLSTRRVDRRDYRVTGIIEAGGQVLNARWNDGEFWQAPTTGIVGTVTQQGTGIPVAHAVVTLEGTHDSATTDALGQFTLSPILAGRYALVASDTTFEVYTGERTQSSTIDVPEGRVVSARSEIPALTTRLTSMCKGQRIRLHTSMLIGRVLQADGSAQLGGEVRGEWQADYVGSRTDRDGKMIEGSVRIDGAAQTSSVDEHGRFVICGVALERPIHLRLVRGDRIADTTFKMFDTLFKAMDWRPVMRAVQP